MRKELLPQGGEGGGRVNPTAAACWYNSHTLCLVVLLERSWMSDRLYPGTRPGRTIALASVVLKGTACIIHVRTCTL